MKYLELTQTFTASMPVYPGDASPELVRDTDGDIVHFDLKSGMHVGTHMDAPLHMLAGGKYLSGYPPEKFFGQGALIDARGQTSVNADLLSSAPIQPGDIVLVMTGFDKKFRQKEYYKSHPVLTENFAKKLVELKVSIVGLDTPSPDRAPYKIHKILLTADILIIENLTNLQALIGHPNFEVIALPAKLQTEAAPCRVVAKFGLV